MKLKTLMILAFICVLAVSVTATQESLKQDLRVFYNFDDINYSAPTLYDLSGNGNDITNNGATDGVTGYFNESFDFELSESDYLGRTQLMTATEAKAGHTVALWLNVESYTADMEINTLMFSTASAFSSEIQYSNSNNRFQVVIYDGGVAVHDLGFGKPSTGTWFQLAYTYDGTTFKGYINGNNTANITDSIGGSSRPDIFYLGGYATSSSYDGLLDEYGLWNRTLTDGEIEELYNRSVGLFEEEEEPPEAEPDVVIEPTYDEYNFYPIIHKFPLNDTDYLTIEDQFNNISVEGAGKTLYNGTNNGASLWSNITGSINGATWDDNFLTFDGDNDDVTISNEITGAISKFTISYWAWSNEDSQDGGLIDKYTDNDNKNWRIHGYSNGMQILIGNGTNTDYKRYSDTYDNNWHHYIITYDNGEIVMFKDGSVKLNSTSNVDFILQDDDDIVLGKRQFSTTYWDGGISDFRFFNNKLNYEEITDLFNNESIKPNLFNNEIRFKLNEGNGTSVYGNTGYYGGSYSFDGVNDYIDITGIEDQVDYSNMTLSAWIYLEDYYNELLIYTSFDTSTSSKYILYGVNGGTGKLRVWSREDGGTATTVTANTLIYLNTWYYVTFVKNSTDVEFYINGDLDATRPLTQNTYTHNGANIGRWGSPSNNFYWNGSLDEIKIWNKTLTETEIENEMYSNAVNNSEGILAYYDFNENQNTTVYDRNYLSYKNNSAKAINFDGTDDYISMTNLEGTSVCVWLYPKPKLQQYIYDARTSGNGYAVVNSIGGIGTDATTTYINGQLGSTLTYNQWNHFCAINTDLNSSTLNIGAFRTGIATWNGSMNDFRIYNRTLIEPEIITLYKGTTFDTSKINTTTETNLSVAEGTVVTFTVDDTNYDTIYWYLDQILQATTATWDWFVGVQDYDEDPEKQVILHASNTTHDDTYIWNIYLTDDFPLIPYNITPKSGVYDSYIPITCFIDDSSYWFKNSTYDFEIYYDDEWYNLSINSTSAYLNAYVLHVPEQDDIQIRCRTFDGVYYSNYTNSSLTNLSIKHKNNKLEVFDISNVRKKTIFNEHAFNTHCKIDDTLANVTIKNIYFDCENDGVWDAVKKYEVNETITEDFLFSSCKYDETGIYNIKAGCVYEKSNDEQKWQIPVCNKLPSTSELCDNNKIYSVVIHDATE